MTELVDRYVHQVGRCLPPKARAEIEPELRSQIQDQLDDRYQGSPSQAEIVTVLSELGDPRRMAASYREERYLVGPALYPTMMTVLQHGWLLIPSIVIFLNIFGALIAPQPRSVLNLLMETLFVGVQTIAIFSSVVVLIFAILQHTGIELHQRTAAFDPLQMPKVDDPGAVDHFETVSGIAGGVIFALVLLYFLNAGGLTLRFNLNDPGEVIPVPMVWLVLLLLAGLAMIFLHLIVLVRNRWGSWVWLVQTVLEVFGVICLYFALLIPIFERISITVPELARLPEIIAIGYALIALITRGITLIRLWHYPASTLQVS